jgi:hypothetical protein
MAENESLDLGNPGGQRWNQFHDAVTKGSSSEDAATIAQRKLPRALKKAFEEFLEHGVSFEQLMAARHDPKALERIVRICDGHEYAHLFSEIALSEPTSSNENLIRSYLDGIVERISDQVALDVVGSANWPTFDKIREYMQDVRKHLETDFQRIIKKLTKDPNWSPTRSKQPKADKSDATQKLLPMSLIGMSKK